MKAKRYVRRVYETINDMYVSEGTSALVINSIEEMELPAVVPGEYAEVLSVYTDKAGNQAVVPPGWTVSGVEKENTIWGRNVGLVIYHIPKAEIRTFKWTDLSELEMLQRKYNQFVWVPVNLLDANGTLDGISFTEKFGRRNYVNSIYFKSWNHEKLTVGLALQRESIKQYGGFYISRYNISKSSKGIPQSVKGVDRWLKTNFYEAKKATSIIVDNESVKSHLTFGAEFDSVLEWFIESKARTYSEIATKDSISWFSHYYLITMNPPKKLVETGSIEGWCTNNIYDFADFISEWTQERRDVGYRVIRGGRSCIDGIRYPVAFRSHRDPNFGHEHNGFRATLYIK